MPGRWYSRHGSPYQQAYARCAYPVPDPADKDRLPRFFLQASAEKFFQLVGKLCDDIFKLTFRHIGA